MEGGAICRKNGSDFCIYQSMQPLFESHHMPCSDCGASVARPERHVHVCDAARLVAFQMFQLRDEIADFDGALAAYLESPQGRFDAWYAARRRGV